MNAHTPRFRMFAGPNGSGKSVIKGAVPQRLLGTYVNPDEIERSIQDDGGWFDLGKFGFPAIETDFRMYLDTSEVLASKKIVVDQDEVLWRGTMVRFGERIAFSYLGSALAEYLRLRLLSSQLDFSTESVMSHPSKVELLRIAQVMGYRTYLYYVSTEDPDINVSRVKQRFAAGGHDVPERKIRDRYVKSMELIRQALPYTNRAYFFDNSFDDRNLDRMWIAEVTDGETLEFKNDRLPDWFRRFVWDPGTQQSEESIAD